MSKKQFDETAIVNELRGGSLFFNKQSDSPTISETEKDGATDHAMPLTSPPVAAVNVGTRYVPGTESGNAAPESTDAPSPGLPPVRTPVRIKRSITRYAFEFFQDQIETLRKYSLDEKIRGEVGSMSQMVREAIDAYIAKRNRTDS
jgi:hypothetical protein